MKVRQVPALVMASEQDLRHSYYAIRTSQALLHLVLAVSFKINLCSVLVYCLDAIFYNAAGCVSRLFQEEPAKLRGTIRDFGILGARTSEFHFVGDFAVFLYLFFAFSEKDCHSNNTVYLQNIETSYTHFLSRCKILKK